MSYRPYLESGALRQMHGLPEQAFDMLVTLLVRICDDPYDPVFSAPTQCRGGGSRTSATSGSSCLWWTKALAWSASSISCGQASGGEEPPSPADVVQAPFPPACARTGDISRAG